MMKRKSAGISLAHLGQLANRVAWPTAIVLVAFAIWMLVRKFLSAPSWPNHGTDLSVYLNAARALTSGGNMYDKINYPADPYGYPPLFAEVIAVLRIVLGDGKLWLLWTGFGAGCLLASLAIMMRGFGVKLAWKWVAMAFGALVAGNLARSDIYHVQPHFILLLLIVIGVRAFGNARLLTGGIAWAVVLVCKPFTGVIVFTLMRRGEWRAVAHTLIAAGILFIGSLLAFIPNIVAGVQGWMEASSYHTTLPNVAKSANESFFGLLQRLFNEPTDFASPWVYMPKLIPMLIAPLLVITIGGIILGTSTKAQWKGTQHSERGAKGLLQTAVVLGFSMSCGPLLEAPHCFMLLPGLAGSAILAAKRWDEGSPIKWRWVAAATAWALTFAWFLIPVSTPLINFYALGHMTGFTILITAKMGAFVMASCLLSVFAQLGDHATQTDRAAFKRVSLEVRRSSLEQ